MTFFVTYILAQAYGLIASQAKRLQDLLAVVEELVQKYFISFSMYY